jgi:hypothetical protein
VGGGKRRTPELHPGRWEAAHTGMDEGFRPASIQGHPEPKTARALRMRKETGRSRHPEPPGVVGARAKVERRGTPLGLASLGSRRSWRRARRGSLAARQPLENQGLPAARDDAQTSGPRPGTRINLVSFLEAWVGVKRRTPELHPGRWGAARTSRDSTSGSFASHHPRPLAQDDTRTSRVENLRLVDSPKSFYAAFLAAIFGSANNARARLRIRSSFGLAFGSFGSRRACEVRSTSTSGFTPCSLMAFPSGVM